jgi:hypothetical protein
MVAFYSVTPGDLEAATQPLQHQDKLTISRNVYPMQNKARGTGAINRCGLKPYYSNFQIRKKSMQKIEKSPASNSGNPNKVIRFSFSEELDEVGFDGSQYNDKIKVDCICPKCGQRHTKTFHWIGRGTPRKYCQSCKGGSNG